MSISSISNPLSSQYLYNNQLYRGVDKNKDNVYSKQEVNSFAKSYEKSTGVSMDVDSLFKAYDADLDGALSGNEYKSVIEDDAMGMSSLYGSFEKAAGLDQSAEADTEASGANKMDEWMASLSGKVKNSLVQSTFKAETTGNLLGAMLGRGNLFASMNAVYQYNSAKNFRSLMQNTYAIRSSFSILL